MNILLDTHALIWALENNPTLSEDAKKAIIEPHNVVFVSAVSIWEIRIKVSLGKITIPHNLQEEIELHRFTPLPIDFHHAETAAALPPIHRDPFDRMLIAQAVIEKLVLVTRDERIAQYEVRLIKA
jgi:PIN domain nuclease of toxin-antitoxin system